MSNNNLINTFCPYLIRRICGGSTGSWPAPSCQKINLANVVIATHAFSNLPVGKSVDRLGPQRLRHLSYPKIIPLIRHCLVLDSPNYFFWFPAFQPSRLPRSAGCLSESSGSRGNRCVCMADDVQTYSYANIERIVGCGGSWWCHTHNHQRWPISEQQCVCSQKHCMQSTCLGLSFVD